MSTPRISQIWISDSMEFRIDFSNDRHYAVDVGGNLTRDEILSRLIPLVSFLQRDDLLNNEE